MSTARPERRRQRATHLTAKKKKVSLKSVCSIFNGLQVRWYRRLDPGQLCRRADVAQLVRLHHRIPPAALCPQSECPTCPLWASVGGLSEAHLADRDLLHHSVALSCFGVGFFLGSGLMCAGKNWHKVLGVETKGQKADAFFFLQFTSSFKKSDSQEKTSRRPCLRLSAESSIVRTVSVI